MKKKLLLKIKRWILTLRKVYSSKKDLITDFIHTENFDGMMQNPIWEQGMNYFNTKDINSDISLSSSTISTFDIIILLSYIFSIRKYFF